MKRKPNPEKVDVENPAWTKSTFAQARAASEVLPELFGKAVAAEMAKPRGRPKSPHSKTLISLRLPKDTLAKWKATGAGWQTRMADALGKLV
jgi:uncharacterized protein (DUF4415 family)